MKPADSPTSPPLDLAPPHRAWLSQLFARYERPLVAYALRLLPRDLERARDCVQETFLALCQQPRSHVEGHVEAWLFKTCRHKAMDHHRRESRMAHSVPLVATPLAHAKASDPAANLVLQEDQQRVADQLRSLPAREQEVLALRMGHGLSYKQIAEVTGLTVNHVGVLLHQAVSQLRTALASEATSL